MANAPCAHSARRVATGRIWETENELVLGGMCRHVVTAVTGSCMNDQATMCDACHHTYVHICTSQYIYEHTFRGRAHTQGNLGGATGMHTPKQLQQ